MSELRMILIGGLTLLYGITIHNTKIIHTIIYCIILLISLLVNEKNDYGDK